MRTAAVTGSMIILFLAGCKQFGDFAAGKKGDAAAITAPTNPNQVILPLFTPAAGSYNATQSVAVASATAGATICYTTDGVTTPDCNATTGTCITGTTYGANISVPASQTLMAMACKAGMINSIVSSAIYTIDSTAPTIALTAPTTGIYVTNAQVSYTTNEACGTGSITWTRTGGTADPGSPRVQALIGAELTSGTHTAVTLANNPALVDGATYSLTFNCTDAAGNAATASTATGVTFDAAVPVISAIAPTNGAFVNTTQVSYTLSETCNTGNVTWTQTGGTVDPGSPRVQALTGGELTAGAHTSITLTNNPALVSGSIYSVSFNCTDFAAQTATTQTSTSVTFDNVVPVISAVSPAASTFVNNTQVSYTMSETCNTGAITWAQTGGTADVGAPHTKALMAAELTAGAHNNITITNNPTLVSGAIYTLTFTCIDASGNAATPITRTAVTYDNTGAVISAVAPASSAYVNNTQVSYTLSEACATGSITWTRTAGTADPGSPRVQALTGAELGAGAHTAITLTNNPALVDGTIYTVQFDCTDAAANAATPITVTNVTYDVTVPVISGVAPLASTFVNHQQVTYTLSETCATGGINWTWTSGTASGSFNQGLIAGELTAGVHGPFTISNNPTLVSGAVYTVTFSCTDLAGNVATPIARTGVTFDNTPPTITIQNLREKSMIHTGTVIGPATDNVAVTVVEFNLDGTTWNAATYAAGAWKFGLPMGAATWKDRSPHTIQVRASDAAGNVTTAGPINVRKGNNRDVNGDGYEDTAVSAFAFTTSTGKAYLFYGSATGVASTTAASAPSNFIGEATTNEFSRNMVIADFNGDGFGDLAVAASKYSTSFGRVYIFPGGAGGIAAAAAASAPVKIVGTTNYNLGSTITAGDVNGDGYADLVASAILQTTSTGGVYVFHGGAGGITATSYTMANSTITGETTNNSFGAAVAVADLNGDSFGDLIVTASGYSGNTGRIYVYNGSGSGITGGAANVTKAMATGEFASDFFGSGITVGDVNGDGFPDIGVAAYNYATTTGKAYLFLNPGGGFALNNASTPASTFIGENTADTFTTSLILGDLNGDGYADLIVGAYGINTQTGRTYIFSGSPGGIATVPAASAPFKIDGVTTTNYFGRGVSIADVNGDGYPDLLSGGPYVSGQQGSAYIFHGGPATVSTSTAASATRIITGEAGTGQFGISFTR